MHECVAEALLQPILALQPPGLAQFAFCKSLSREQLRDLLRDDELLDEMEEVLWAGVTQLGEQAHALGECPQPRRVAGRDRTRR